ncbi:MAG TPA: hypothetical protein VHB99_08400 [Pirellulales bacterium]|nr:hypothetical protein [Pirellulales bacterium]
MRRLESSIRSRMRKISSMFMFHFTRRRKKKLRRDPLADFSAQHGFDGIRTLSGVRGASG